MRKDILLPYLRFLTDCADHLRLGTRKLLSMHFSATHCDAQSAEALSLERGFADENNEKRYESLESIAIVLKC